MGAHLHGRGAHRSRRRVAGGKDIRRLDNADSRPYGRGSPGRLTHECWVMNRRTRVLVEMVRRLPRPNPPPPRYLARIRRELPQPLARMVLGRVAPDVRVSEIRIPVADVALRVRIYRTDGEGR